MPIRPEQKSFWDSLQNIPYPALISDAVDHLITDTVPERTQGIWLNLTDDSLDALLEMCTLAVKLRQHHLWFQLKKAHEDTPIDIWSEQDYRLVLYEVSKAMDFPLEGGTIIFSDEEECPDIEILTVTDARLDTDCVDDCIPPDPEE